MKASYDKSWHSNKMHLPALLHNQNFFLWHIGRAFLILTIVCASCIPISPTPTPPGPPATANGQAVLSWGGNSSGQLGDGSTFQRLTPSLVALRDIRAIAAGGNYSLALTADGRVLEWGGGQTTPTEVAGLTSIKQVAAGRRHRLALKDDGTVLAWGDNNHGQLGDGSNSTRSTPVQVVGLNNVLGIAAGGDHSLAIRGDFGVWAWGANSEGQLGDGTKTDRLTPVAVPGIKAIEVAASSNHTVALTTDVKVMGWGSNSECQLGVDPRSNPFDPILCSEHLQPTIMFQKQATPYPSTKGHAIAATASTTLVVLSDGTVYGFGGQGDPIPGQFRGMCNSDLALGAAVIYGLPAVEEVVAGTTHALFRTAAGEVWSLGANSAGQGGLGTTSVQECAHVIPSATVRGASQIAGGEEHSLGLIKGSLSFTPPAVDFGNQPFGTGNPSSMDVTIANTGLAPVTFYDIGISGLGDYSFTEDCPDKPAILAPSANCTIKITFAPAALGQRDGHIGLVHDGQGGRQEIALTGIGTEANVAFSPTVINFGTQAVATTSAAQTVTIQNNGAAPLLINTITATAGFSVITDICPRTPNAIPVQGTCTVDVAFTPSVAGVAVGELRVTYEPNSKVAKMQLEGTGN